MLIGLMLMPLGIRQRRRALLMAFAALALMVTLASCGGSSSSAPTGISRPVSGGGMLSSPVKLSTITVKSGSASISTVQSLTGIGFGG